MTAFVEQKAQIGTETAAGTAVPATRRLASSTLTMTDKRETGKVRPSGEYYTGIVYKKFESTEGKIEGTPCYRELRQLLAVSLGAPVSTEITPGASKHVFGLNPVRPTWTVEYGSATLASKVAGVFASGLTLEWSANSGDSKVTVDLLGGPLQDGAALTSGTTAVAPLPIIAETVKVFVDSTFAALGTTQLTEMLATTVKFTELAAIVRYLGGVAGRVNTIPSATVEIVAEASTRVRDLRSSSQVRYVRVEATGTALPGAELVPGTPIPAKLTIDFACQTAEHTRGESDAVYASTIGFEVVKDATGFVPTFTLVTDQV